MSNSIVISDEIQEEVEMLFVDVEFVSPYQLAKYLSTLMSKKINPQMMYNYNKNNLLATSLSSTQKLQVSKEEAIRFCAKYVTNNRKD